jgi:hypothetical protein
LAVSLCAASAAEAADFKQLRNQGIEYFKRRRYDAAIKAHDGEAYDRNKFRPEVSEAAGKTSSRVMAALTKSPKAACADYGGTSVEQGLLRRY